MFEPLEFLPSHQASNPLYADAMHDLSNLPFYGYFDTSTEGAADALQRAYDAELSRMSDKDAMYKILADAHDRSHGINPAIFDINYDGKEQYHHHPPLPHVSKFAFGNSEELMDVANGQFFSSPHRCHEEYYQAGVQPQNTTSLAVPHIAASGFPFTFRADSPKARSGSAAGTLALGQTDPSATPSGLCLPSGHGGVGDVSMDAYDSPEDDPFFAPYAKLFCDDEPEAALVEVAPSSTASSNQVAATDEHPEPEDLDSDSDNDSDSDDEWDGYESDRPRRPIDAPWLKNFVDCPTPQEVPRRTVPSVSDDDDMDSSSESDDSDYEDPSCQGAQRKRKARQSATTGRRKAAKVSPLSIIGSSRGSSVASPPRSPATSASLTKASVSTTKTARPKVPHKKASAPKRKFSASTKASARSRGSTRSQGVARIRKATEDQCAGDAEGIPPPPRPAGNVRIGNGFFERQPTDQVDLDKMLKAEADGVPFFYIAGKKKYKCPRPECPKITGSRGDLRRHLAKVDHTPRGFFCYGCVQEDADIWGWTRLDPLTRHLENSSARHVRMHLEAVRREDARERWLKLFEIAQQAYAAMYS